MGVPKKDDAFKTHPMNLLCERTLKGAFYGNYKPRTDIPMVVDKYLNKVRRCPVYRLQNIVHFGDDFVEIVAGAGAGHGQVHHTLSAFCGY